MFELTTEALILVVRLALLAVLYLFLGLLVLTALRAARGVTSGSGAAALTGPGAGRSGRLIVVEPGSTSLARGEALPLRPVTSLGRSAANTIVLDATFISAEHAVISQRDGYWWLTDRESTNGTLVNERPVRGEIALSPGDVVGLGDVRLRVTA